MQDYLKIIKKRDFEAVAKITKNKVGLIVALKNLVDQRKISTQPAVSVDTVLKTQTT
jgi:hypothetical protein